MAIVRSTTGYDIERDLRTVEHMSARLTPYVYENELYGSMPGDLVKLTVGGMLMRVQRLSAVAYLLSPKQRETLTKAQQKLEEVRRQWRVALEGKIQRELQARVKSIDQFIMDCSDNPKNCKENFPSTAEQRVILEALLDEAVQFGILTDTMKNGMVVLDNKLHRYVGDGEFMWDKRLEKAYPKDKYWFLYSK
jgi:hypothetical protein